MLLVTAVRKPDGRRTGRLALRRDPSESLCPWKGIARSVTVRGVVNPDTAWYYTYATSPLALRVKNHVAF